MPVEDAAVDRAHDLRRDEAPRVAARQRRLGARVVVARALRLLPQQRLHLRRPHAVAGRAIASARRSVLGDAEAREILERNVDAARARDRRARRAGCWSAAARRRDRSRTGASAGPRSRRSPRTSGRPRTRPGCSIRRDRRTSRSGGVPRSISTPSISASNAPRGRLNAATSGASARPCGVCGRAAVECARQLVAPARQLRSPRLPLAIASSTASSTARQKSQTRDDRAPLVGGQHQERVVEIGVASH